MPRGVIVVCGLLLLLAAMWWSMQGQAIAPPMPPASPASVVSSPSAPGAAVVADEVSADRSAAAPVADARSIPADATWIDVLVVDKANGQPVAGADVDYYDDACVERWQALPAAERDAVRRTKGGIAEPFGWRGRSDVDGKVRVHFTTSYAVAQCYRGSLFGRVRITRTVLPGGYRLELAADRTVAVQVLDANGNPAGEVRVRIQTPTQNGTLNARFLDTTSRADGIVTFRHLQNGQWAGPDEPGTWWARLAVPGAENVAAAFDGMAPPAAPIVLRLPPTGSLALRVTYQGVPLVDQPFIGLYVGQAEDQEQRNEAWQLRPGEGGRALFDPVPLQCRFLAFANVDGATLQQQVPGPVAMGQRVEADLDVGTGMVLVTGRCFDAEGRVLVKQRLSFHYRTNIEGGSGGVQTDASGCFTRFFDSAADERLELRELVLTSEVSNGAPLRIEVPPQQLVYGRNDLGDLRPQNMPLVVSGRFVVDRPVVAADILFWVQQLGTPRGPDGDAPWRTVQDLASSLQPDGRFEVRGTLPAGRYRLSLPARSHLPVPPIEFTPGRQGLVIPIDFGNVLLASCRLPEGVEANALQAVLRPKLPPPTETPEPGGARPFYRFDRFTATTWNDGQRTQCRWRALPAGSCTLELRMSGYPNVLLTIADVQLPAPAGGDARLVDIDLRSAMRTVLLHVTLPAQDPALPVGSIVVLPMPQADREAQVGYTMAGGELRIMAPSGPIDLFVGYPGLKPQLVHVVDHEANVALEPWPRLTLRLLGAPELPTGFVLRAGTSSAASRSQQRYKANDQLGSMAGLLAPWDFTTVADGTASVPLGDDVSHIDVFLSDARSQHTRALKSIVPAEVASGTPSLTVQLDADEVKAAIKELQALPPSKR